MSLLIVLYRLLGYLIKHSGIGTAPYFLQLNGQQQILTQTCRSSYACKRVKKIRSPAVSSADC